MEKILGDEAYNVVLREYEDNAMAKSLQSVIVITCKDYSKFCRIVEAVQDILDE